MESKDTTQWDVDDLIFGEEDGGASDKNSYFQSLQEEKSGL